MRKKKAKTSKRHSDGSEKELMEFNRELKNWMFPVKKFTAYFKEYIWIIHNDFEEYELILEKLGIGSVGEMIKGIFGIYETALDHDKDFFGTITGDLIKDIEKDQPQSEEEFVNNVLSKYAGEEMIPSLGRFTKNVEDSKALDKFDIDEKLKLLNEQERQIFEYFLALIMKLWTRYVIVNGFDKNPIFQMWMKNQVVSLFERLNALYEMELIPSRLISYIEGIEIPNAKTLGLNIDSLNINPKMLSTGTPLVSKSVSKIHFGDRSPAEFERLVFAYALRQKNWTSIEWLGEVGKDGGRDIWGVYRRQTYCYLCANYGKLDLRKAQSDIDKLKAKRTVPDHLIVVCGGTISRELREKIDAYAVTAGAKKARSITGGEFEEILRHESPDLIERFFNGVVFPDSLQDIQKFSDESRSQTLPQLPE
jgi:hypothetical protein